MYTDAVIFDMASEETYVPGIIRWLIVGAIVGLVLVAAFWRPESVVTRSGPFGIADERTWVEGVAYGAVTLGLVYALAPTTRRTQISPLTIPVFVVPFASLVEIGQAVFGVTPFQTADLAAAAICSTIVALVWDAGRRAFEQPPV